MHKYQHNTLGIQKTVSPYVSPMSIVWTQLLLHDKLFNLSKSETVPANKDNQTAHLK